MRYELQLKFYNMYDQSKIAWDTIQSFPYPNYGAAIDEYNRMSRVDKYRTYRLISVDYKVIAGEV